MSSGGSGAYVDVNSGNVVLTETYDRIAQTQSDFVDSVALWSDKLDDAITNIEAVIASTAPTLGAFPAISDITVPTGNFPAAPTFSDLNLSDYPDINFTAPVLTPYGNLDFSYVTPVPPSDISPSFNWTGTAYTSEMWTALFNKVHGDILNGGTGLTDAVHAAIVEREKETRRNNQDAALQSALDAVGTSGFNLPSGHVAAVQTNIANEILEKDQDALNNLTIKDFDLATENTRFAITTGADLEKMLRATWDAVESRGFEAAKASADYIVAVYEANIQKYIASWEGIKLDLEAMKAKIDAITATNDGLIKVYLGEAQVYESQVDAISAKNKGLVDTRNGEINVYATTVDAAGKELDGLISGMNAELTKSKLEIDAVVAAGNYDLSVYTDKAKLSADSAEAVGNLTAQIIASTLGAINTSLSSGYSASESRGESYGFSAGITESHSYEDA